jgi:DNA-binding NarL/FixJ family response regulator
MKKVILFTKMSSIEKHWQKALQDKYQPISFDDFNKLIKYLDSHEEIIILMFDEMSVSDIYTTMQKFNKYKFLTTLLFNARPEVHHASTLLKERIKGYENSYIHKENLLKMLQAVEDGKKWFFSDLTNFIINNYINDIEKKEPDFLHLLTEQEKDIAIMIADGFSNKAIAQNKRIALSTVKGHIHHIFEKAGVSDRVSLALKFKN